MSSGESDRTGSDARSCDTNKIDTPASLTPGGAAATGAIWELIDRDTTLARLAGDLELLHQLMDFFREDCPPLLARLRECLERNDVECFERACHSLKGLAANLGAASAAQEAGNGENAARAGDMAAAARMLRQIEPCFADLQQRISVYRAAAP